MPFHTLGKSMKTRLSCCSQKTPGCPFAVPSWLLSPPQSPTRASGNCARHSVNVIGSKIRLTSGSISIAIDRLEEKGLVERRDDPDDRRARVVHLTPEGRKLIACAFAQHAAAMEHATSGLSTAERQEAIRLLKKLGTKASTLQPRRSAS